MLSFMGRWGKLDLKKTLGTQGEVHSNSPNPGALGPGTARNSEMSVSGNSQSSTSLYIVSYRHKFLLYMYMYTTIKNTSSVTILWKILCNFSLFKGGRTPEVKTPPLTPTLN